MACHLTFVICRVGLKEHRRLAATARHVPQFGQVMGVAQAVECTQEPSPRLHHTLTRLANGHALLVGGRGSPLRPCNDLVVLDPSANPLVYTPAMTDALLRRWRHAACLLADDTMLIITGGLTVEEGQRQPQLHPSSCIALVSNDDWASVSQTVVVPGSDVQRHSHVSVPVSKDTILTHGGLGKKERSGWQSCHM